MEALLIGRFGDIQEKISPTLYFQVQPVLSLLCPNINAGTLVHVIRGADPSSGPFRHDGGKATSIIRILV